MQPQTHLSIDARLCGQAVELADGRAVVHLTTTEAMSADVRGLVHGGFIFGLADYAAMLAVNDPNVVLGAAETRFIAPVRLGERVIATATRAAAEGRKQLIEVRCAVEDREVMRGTFTTFTLDRHVLDT